MATGKLNNECDVSVAICTYNRPAMLSGVLECLALQEYVKRLNWEILVVDNHPAATAKPVLDAYLSDFRPRIRYIHEATPGLSRARNRAIHEAGGAVIAFLDDDVMVPKTWLVEMLRAFERTDADCIGGRVLVKWEGQPDDSVLACEKDLVAFDKGDADIRLSGREVPIGANLALRATVLQDERLFMCDLGRTRTNLMGCEEIELLLRLLRRGRRMWYSAGSVVLHRTGGERLLARYYINREYWNGVSLAAVDKRQLNSLYCYCKAWIRLTQIVATVLPSAVWARLTNDRRIQLLSACQLRKYLGYWCEVMGIATKPA